LVRLVLASHAMPRSTSHQHLPNSNEAAELTTENRSAFLLPSFFQEQFLLLLLMSRTPLVPAPLDQEELPCPSSLNKRPLAFGQTIPPRPEHSFLQYSFREQGCLLLQ
jgi:hypothetical protein